EHLTAAHRLEGAEHEADTLLERDPKARHTGIGDENNAGGALAQECGDDAPATADDVAVADDRHSRAVLIGRRIRGDEQLLRDELRRAVEIDGLDRLVGAEGDDLLDAAL